MTISPERQSMWWSFIRSSPLTNMFYPLILLLHNPGRKPLFFLLAYIFVFITNGIEKKISKTIYELLGVETIPIIGSGERPDGASNCGTYLVYPDKPASSYGMPSGHSELGWFFTTYLILDLVSKNCSNNDNNVFFILLCIIGLLGYAIINSYARVVIEKCHTFGQVFVGGILGIIKGVIFHILKRVII